MRTASLINVAFWMTSIAVGVITRMTYKAGWFFIAMLVISLVGCGVIEAMEQVARRPLPQPYINLELFPIPKPVGELHSSDAEKYAYSHKRAEASRYKTKIAQS